MDPRAAFKATQQSITPQGPSAVVTNEDQLVAAAESLRGQGWPELQIWIYLEIAHTQLEKEFDWKDLSKKAIVRRVRTRIGSGAPTDPGTYSRHFVKLVALNLITAVKTRRLRYGWHPWKLSADGLRLYSRLMGHVAAANPAAELARIHALVESVAAATLEAHRDLRARIEDVASLVIPKAKTRREDAGLPRELRGIVGNAKAACRQRDYEAATLLYADAARQASRHATAPASAFVAILNGLGDSLVGQLRLSEALRAYEAVFEIHRMHPLTITKVALVHLIRKEPRDALETANLAIEEAAKIGDDVALAVAFMVKGTALYDLQSYSRSIDAYRAAMKKADATGNEDMAVRVVRLHALALERMGNIDEAKHMHTLARKNAKRLGVELEGSDVEELVGQLVARLDIAGRPRA